MKTMKGLLSVVATVAAAAAWGITDAQLEKGFFDPPASARPHTWWHWMNGNVTKEGITADLEAMAQIGLGGAQIFDAGCDVPPGPVVFNSPLWFETIRHALSEAKRLGLEIVHPNCSGWSSSGGPWIAPSNAMKSVVFSKAEVRGPKRFSAKLAQPHTPRDYYRDFRVVAFRIPAAEVADREKVPCRITTPQTDDPKELAKLTDGNLNTYVEMQRKESDKHVFTVEYGRSVEAACVAYQLDGGDNWGEVAEMEVEVSADGKQWRGMGRRPVRITAAGGHTRERGWRFFPFDGPVSAKFLRVRFHFGRGGTYQEFKLGELGLARRMAISALRGKTFDMRIPVVIDHAPTTADQVVPRNGTVDLTRFMAPDGTLEWNVPEGDWCILRVGYSAKAAGVVSASNGGRGLECDKLSADALNHHFESYFGHLCRELKGMTGRDRPGLTGTLVDSYEVGTQNWTEGFEHLFEKRAGYSLEPFLPVFSGRIVGSVEETERFLWDYRRVIADLFEESYSDALAAKCRQYNLTFSLEPYGSCPSDDFRYGEAADIPMGEFWAGGTPGAGGRSRSAMLVASIAHVYGRKYIGMESFTSSPPWQGRWRNDPFALKALGDRVFACGANRIIFHRFTHQPWAKDKYLPGMTMGRWGMHFDRSNTWWEHGGKEWMAYLTRTQYMLQEGTFCADVLFCGTEDMPLGFADIEHAFKDSFGTILNRHGFDFCTAAVLAKLKVEDRRIVSPGGVRYRLLALQPHDTMTPEMLREVSRLVEAGATVSCERPPVRSPSLVGYPAVDAALAREAERVWQRGVLRLSPAAALEALGLQPDVACANAAVMEKLAWQHRCAGAADWYFVACDNPSAPLSAECSFRVDDRMPEIWDAERQRIAPARNWRVENGRTFVTLEFQNSGALFVMFRKPRGDCAGTSAPAPAPRLRVVKAEYGLFPGKIADVTDKVASMVAGDALKVRASNALADRDPAPNKIKQLRIVYHDGVREAVAITNEHQSIFLAAAPLLGGMKVDGPWSVAFPQDFAPNAHAKGADETLNFGELVSWTARPEKDVRYFSGTATYRKTVKGVKVPNVAKGERLMLDLGDVKNIAEVKVNGKVYPTLWKPPFRLDVTEAVTDGTVELEVKVTNLWPNRLIGDDFLPPDCEWTARMNRGKTEWGIKEILQGVKEGKPSPTGRHTFTTWKHWTKDDEPLASGLLGPVMFRSVTNDCQAADGAGSANYQLSTTNCQLERIASLSFVPYTGTVTNLHVAGKKGSEYLTFDYVIHAEKGSEILCRMSMPPPERWDGRLWGHGHGGYAGNVWNRPAPNGGARVMCDLGMGRATGHRTHWPTLMNEAEWKDFGWRGTHLMTVFAKRFCEAYYGKPPHHSYFLGGSTGGGQALHEATRFPEDYDGVIASVPAQGRTALEASHFHRYLMLSENGRDVLTTNQLQIVSDAAIEFMKDHDEAYCAGKYLSDPRECEPFENEIFDLAAKKDPVFARPDIRRRLHEIYAGPVVDGRRIHHGYPFGARITHSSRFFLFGNHQLGLKGAPEPKDATWKDFIAFIAARSKDIDAMNPDLRQFAARGGKILSFVGFEDQTVPFAASLQHWEDVATLFGSVEAVRGFYRMYFLPGAAHGGIGRATRSLLGYGGDMNERMIDWVEKGIPPEDLEMKTHFGDTIKVAPYPEKAYRDADGTWKRKPALRTIRRAAKF